MLVVTICSLCGWSQQVDEGVLSCLFAYMKKAGEDELDGMVSIFQVSLSLARCAVPLCFEKVQLFGLCW